MGVAANVFINCQTGFIFSLHTTFVSTTMAPTNEDAPAKKEYGRKNNGAHLKVPDHLKVPRNTYVPTAKEYVCTNWETKRKSSRTEEQEEGLGR